MLVTEPQSAPPIEDQILEAIISGSLPEAPGSAHLKSEIPNPTSLALRFRLPLSKVLDILVDPRTRTRIAAAQELRDLAFHQREQVAREKALTALESILDTTDDPIEKRRAATAILRRHSNRNPFWPRIPGAAAATDDLDEDLDEEPTPRTPLPAPEYPLWCHTARHGLIRVLTRLQDNDNPSPNAGLVTLYRHKYTYKRYGQPQEDRDRALAEYLEDPGDEGALTGFSCAILHGADTEPTSKSPGYPNNVPDTCAEQVTLHWPDHHRTVTVHFSANKTPAAVLWEVDRIDVGPKVPTDSS